MPKLLFALLLSSTFLLAQDNGSMSREDAKDSKGQITVRGCVSRSGGDYILMKQNPSMTYELHGTGEIRLKNYLGQRVELTGREHPSMSTSSDAMNKTGSAAATTIDVTSITTVDKSCSSR
jgi:hypothetical protein